MTREDIIRMAREAGWDMEWGGTTIEQVQSFAALATAHEREACAKLCLEEAPSLDGQLCAAAIRARGVSDV